MRDRSHYWSLVKINIGDGRHRIQAIVPAQEFFLRQFPNSTSLSSDRSVQEQLLSHTQTATGLKAELCLRCYISHPILVACQRRARLFGGGDRFTYCDLLPFVLNDEGRLDFGNYIPFSLEILRSYRPGQGSLAGWAELRVKRHPELNQFLLEWGLQLSSDWALLNRAKLDHLEPLERSLVQVFHAVYRRDRPQQRLARQKCAEPTSAQLMQMLEQLREQQILLGRADELLHRLRQIALKLRQNEIWGRRGAPLAESLELELNGEVIERELPDPASTLDPEETERLELQTFCRQQLLTYLDAAIQRGVSDRLAALKRSSRRAHLAPHFLPALRLLYIESKSQTAIASLLGLKDQSEVCRMLDLKSVVSEVRRLTQEQLLVSLLEKAKQLGLIQEPLQPDYLTNLMQQVECFVDETVFAEAASELRVSKNRVMKSLYAQRLCQILNCASPSKSLVTVSMRKSSHDYSE